MSARTTMAGEPMLTRPWFGVSELAAMLSVSRWTVRRRLIRAGIKIDGSGDKGKVWTSQLAEKMPEAWNAMVSAAAMREAGIA